MSLKTPKDMTEGWAAPTPAAEGLPEMPDNIGELDGSMLAELYQRVEGWHAYVSSLAGAARQDILAVQSLRILRRAEIGRAMREQLATRREIEDAITLDAEHQRLAGEELSLEQRRIQLGGVLERLTRQAKMLSRHIELRRQDIEIARLDGRAFTRATVHAAAKRRPKARKR